jgi:ABC-type nitrate/sulfonate/bicarbonate transport system permease component
MNGRFAVGWLLGGATLLLLWGAGTTRYGNQLIPSPQDVFLALSHDVCKHFLNAMQTGLEGILGLALASLVGVVLVVAVGLYPDTEPFFYPTITLLKASPAVVFVPLFVVLVGSGTASKVLVSALISFFPLVMGGIDGIKRMPQRLQLSVQVYGASSRSEFRKIGWGYALSGLVSGLKTAAPLSIVGAIVGEYMTGGRPEGIGTYIMTGNANGNYIAVYEGMVTATILGMSFFLFANYAAYSTNRFLHLTK